MLVVEIIGNNNAFTQCSYSEFELLTIGLIHTINVNDLTSLSYELLKGAGHACLSQPIRFDQKPFQQEKLASATEYNNMHSYHYTAVYT